VSLRVPYKIFPLTTPEPALPNERETWVPILNVSLIIGHAPTRKFEAIVDSGSPSCLFHADIGKAHGLKIESGTPGPLSGVVGGSKGVVYYHAVKLVVPGNMISITGGFSENLSVAAILGRHGFFENYVVIFDPSSNPPGLLIERVHRA